MAGERDSGLGEEEKPSLWEVAKMVCSNGSRLPHGSQFGSDATGREAMGKTAWPLPEDGGGHQHRCRHRPKKGPWEGRGAYSVPCGENSCVDTLWSSADLKGAELTKGTCCVPADIVACSEPL